MSFSEGLERTIKWFFENHEREEVAKDFEAALTERAIEKGTIEVPEAVSLPSGRTFSKA